MVGLFYSNGKELKERKIQELNDECEKRNKYLIETENQLQSERFEFEQLKLSQNEEQSGALTLYDSLLI